MKVEIQLKMTALPMTNSREHKLISPSFKISPK